MTGEGGFPRRLRGEGPLGGGACAVVLVRGSETQFHLGLRRSDALHEPVLHLAWHRRLLDQSLAQVTHARGQALPAAVVALTIDPLVDEALQVLAGRVARRYANQPSPIAYGFGESAAGFTSETGESTDPDAAFTCATFVLALLRSVGVRLIDPQRWRAPTEEDLAWQRDIGEHLLSWIEAHVHGDLPRAKERVEHDRGSRRYRPTDVAGAALFGPARWPVGAEDVDPRARELEASLPWSGSTA